MKKNLRSMAFLGLLFSFQLCFGQNGTADGIYHFGNLGADNSGGTGFKKQGDKFAVSNVCKLDASDNSIYYGFRPVNKGMQGDVVIKAEGGSVCKRFTIKDMALYTFAGTYYQKWAYLKFVITLRNESGGIIASHQITSAVEIGLNAIIRLRDIPFSTPWPANGYSGVARIELSYIANDEHPEILGFKNMTIANVSANTLPVDFAGLEVKKQSNGVLLNWKTLSEQDNSYFEVFRSSEDQKYTSIGKVQGNGNSSVGHSYTFRDERPLLGDNYYRLMQVDRDGTSQVLADKVLDFGLSQLVEVYPNPAIEKLNVRFAEGQFNSLMLSSAEGKVLQRFKVEGVKSPLELDLSAYAKGIYLIQLTGKGGDHVHRVVRN
jgi:hypothetical protein